MPITYYTEEEYNELLFQYKEIRTQLRDVNDKLDAAQKYAIYNYLKAFKVEMGEQNAFHWRRKIEQDYLEAKKQVTS